MRSMKTAGAAAVAVLAVMAFVGASTAAATTTTTLCSTSALPCPSAKQYPAGAFEAKSSAVTINTSSKADTISCSGSTLVGKTTASNGNPLPVAFSSLSLGGCSTGEGVVCKVIERNLPYNGSIRWEKENTGSLKVEQGGGGKPGWKIVCGTAVSCEFTGEPTLDISEGQLVASEEALEHDSGLFCPSSAKLSASYTIVNPSPVYTAYLPAPPGTTFCKTDDEGLCPEKERLPDGTRFEATSSNLKITTNLGPITCSSSKIIGTVGSPTESGALPVSGDDWTLSGCRIASIGCSATRNERSNWTATWLSGSDGWMNSDGKFSWFFSCYPNLPSFTATATPSAVLMGGSPATLVFSEVPVQTGLFATAQLSATFNLSSPNPLYVATSS